MWNINGRAGVWGRAVDEQGCRHERPAVTDRRKGANLRPTQRQARERVWDPPALIPSGGTSKGRAGEEGRFRHPHSRGDAWGCPSLHHRPGSPETM